MNLLGLALTLLYLSTHAEITVCQDATVNFQKKEFKGTFPSDSSKKLEESKGTVTEWISDFLSNDARFGTIIVSLLSLQALVLLLMGQPLISRSGKIKLWEGNINGQENSQQISDWYTFTHIMHGFIFYGIGAGITLFVPSIDIGVKGFFIMGLITEILWEIVENTPAVIKRYRNTALANGYNGDSVLNSVCDAVGMSLGFWLAYLLPPLAALGILVIEEVVLAIVIRDNLTLNIIQLIHPFESISKWQTNEPQPQPEQTDLDHTE